MYVGREKRLHLDNEVDAVGNAVYIGLSSFIQWLVMIPEKRKIQLAHNSKRFDMLILIRTLAENGPTSDFKASCIDFVDTLPCYEQN